MSSAVLANYRKARAVELALSGASYDEIAHQLDLANRGTAWRLVQTALKERRFAAVDAYREGELERLRALEEQLLPRVRKGHLGAINAELTVIDRRVRLLDLVPRATKEGNQCSCGPCAVHGRAGSWWPAPQQEDPPPSGVRSAQVVAEVEAQLERWMGELGLAAVFDVLAAVGHAIELAAWAEAQASADDERFGA